MSTHPEPEWLQTARANGLTITQQGVDMAKLLAPPEKKPTKPLTLEKVRRDHLKRRKAEKAARQSNPGQLDATPPAKPSRKGQVQVRHEDGLQKKVVDLAQLCGWRVAHFRHVKVMGKKGPYHVTPVAADGKGFPDLVMLKGSRIVVAELKAKTKETPEQLLWLAAFQAASVPVFVWTEGSWPEIEKVLKS